jgi:hypothetical protein
VTLTLAQKHYRTGEVEALCPPEANCWMCSGDFRGGPPLNAAELPFGRRSKMNETRSLPCPLSEHEVAERAHKLAKAALDLVALDVKKKLAASQFKEEHELLNSNAKQLAREVHTRQEMRDVEIEYQHDDIRLAVDTIRCDTGEVIHSRPMTADEAKDARQAKLPGIGRSRRQRTEDAS